jgi:hypothetical protein
LITGLISAASPRLHISSTCKVGQKLGVSLPLLKCSLSAWPSRLLYRKGRKCWRDLWITLHTWLFLIVRLLVNSTKQKLCSVHIFNTLAYTAGCETGWAIDAFAVNSGFGSVDGMKCLITFESWRNDLSNDISYI